MIKTKQIEFIKGHKTELNLLKLRQRVYDVKEQKINILNIYYLII